MYELSHVATLQQCTRCIAATADAVRCPKDYSYEDGLLSPVEEGASRTIARIAPGEHENKSRTTHSSFREPRQGGIVLKTKTKVERNVVFSIRAVI